jgi:NAD(P)-dependent dehydrogenase (short-subunit alcohol dehydrogenase family)
VAAIRRRADVLTALAGAAGTALCAWAVAPGTVGDVEQALFRFVNAWPDVLQWPLWTFQTLGVLGMPIPRIGEPEEVARLVVFVASHDASYSTGSEFVVDGGTVTGQVPPAGPV